MQKILLFYFFFILFSGCIDLSNEQKDLPQQPDHSNFSSPPLNSTKENLSFNEDLKKVQETINTSLNNSSINYTSIEFEVLDKCSNFSDEENKTKCYINLALELDEPNYCFFIDYGEKFKTCLNSWCKITKKFYLSDCEKYPDAKKRVLCLENCINKKD